MLLTLLRRKLGGTDKETVKLDGVPNRMKKVSKQFPVVLAPSPNSGSHTVSLQSALWEATNPDPVTLSFPLQIAIFYSKHSRPLF